MERCLGWCGERAGAAGREPRPTDAAGRESVADAVAVKGNNHDNFWPLVNFCITPDMEQDRQQADISTPELDGETIAATKQPKKRFIGRRAAAEKAAAKGDTNGGIEDSGAIQGSHLVLSSHLEFANMPTQSLHREGVPEP